MRRLAVVVVLGLGGAAVAAPAAKATVSIGAPTVKGGLDEAVITRYLKRNLLRLQFCYEHRLRAKPALQGTVTLEFAIETRGRVASSKATGLDDEAAEICMASVIKTIEFPKPTNAGLVMATYPLTFHPAPKARAPKAPKP